MWPRLWVGRFMCCVNLKPFSVSVKSADVHVVESKQRLKSPRRSMDGEMEDYQKQEEIRQKTWIWYGEAINNSDNKRTGSTEFEGKMFKR